MKLDNSSKVGYSVVLFLVCALAAFGIGIYGDSAMYYVIAALLVGISGSVMLAAIFRSDKATR